MVKKNKRKACAKKQRVVSAIPGTQRVTVFCVHGCGISYTTPPQHINKTTWHKTIRKLNAHESQRCPKNPGCTRRPRKHAKVRASSTANPSILETAKTSKALIRKAGVVSTTTPTPGSTLEQQEYESRLEEEAIIQRHPKLEPSVVTGVYWTHPSENTKNSQLALALYNREQRRRCAEPAWIQLQRQRFARQFTHTVFPEFYKELKQRRRHLNQFSFGSSLEGLPTMIPSSKSKPRFGTIDTPDVLTMRKLSFGLGQQVDVYSEADGGHRVANIVGVGGHHGSSVLVQFFATNGTLKQQLHNSDGVPSGDRRRRCQFDERTKISDFVVQQLAEPVTSCAVTSCAGTEGPKLASVPCDDLAMEFDDDDFDMTWDELETSCNNIAACGSVLPSEAHSDADLDLLNSAHDDFPSTIGEDEWGTFDGDLETLARDVLNTDGEHRIKRRSTFRQIELDNLFDACDWTNLQPSTSQSTFNLGDSTVF